jgi:hypothetical protein
LIGHEVEHTYTHKKRSAGPVSLVK